MARAAQMKKVEEVARERRTRVTGASNHIGVRLRPEESAILKRVSDSPSEAVHVLIKWAEEAWAREAK